MGTLLLCLFSSLCLFFLALLINLLKRVWWTPIHIQAVLRSQGIKGPSYRFLHGSTKEIMNMKKEVTSSPMPLSHEIFPRVHPHIYSWIKLYGDNFLMYGPRAELVVSEPELIKEVLGNKDGAYPKEEVEDYMTKLIGDSIIITRGKKWTRLRKIANHAFHSESLKGMVPAMIQSVEMMLERWRKHKGQEIEVFQEFRILTSEVISRTAFGSSYHEGENIFSMVTRLIILVTRNRYRARIPGIGKFFKTSDDIESDKIEQGIRHSMLKMIRKREEEAMRGRSDSYGSDYLGMLVKSNHDADKGMGLSVDDMIDECKAFYVAGHETSTGSLSWTVFLLAIYTDWQEKAREEVLELFGQEKPTPDGISRMKIMSMIINEALRLYPPVVYLTREVISKVKLGKLTLPEKLKVAVPVLAVHHDHRIWGEDVHLFKPERFAEGLAKATNNNAAAFFPFGTGPRNCVGSNFALTETKIALSMILQQYSFALSPTYIHSPLHLLTLNPEHGVQVKFQAL